METELVARLLWGLGLMLSWWISMTWIVHTDDMLYNRGVLGNLLLDARRRRFIPATLVYVACVSCFVFQWMEWVAGCATIACVLWIRHKETQLWSGNLVVRLGKYAPSAACLLVYLVGYALAPLFGMSSSGLGVDLACGALGAAWCITGWKKLQLSGVRWMSTRSIGLLIAERAYIGPPILRSLRRGIVRSPALLLAIGIIGIVVELAGIAFCFPSLRLTYAITIDVFLIGIALLLGYTEPEWVVIILALALL